MNYLEKTTFVIGSLLAFCVCAPLVHGQVIPNHISERVFTGGAEGPTGTSNYRIPSITVAPNGDLLAFVEARRSSSDPGAAGKPIDMAMKRSTDGGLTWTDYTVMHSNSAFDYSDPRAVVDANTGTVHLLYTQCVDGGSKRRRGAAEYGGAGLLTVSKG